LKDLSSKLFKSDKTLIDLIYNNKKIDMNNENLLIHDLIPKGKNSTVLTIQMNEGNQKEKIKNKISVEKAVKKKEIKDNDLSNNELNYNIQAYNNKNNKNLKVNNTNNNIAYENTTFIAYYIKKSNELFLMMKEFNDKVKEIDNNLNKKKKYFDIDSDNNIFYYEVSLFEKRLIDFLNIQIKFYKELLQILNNEDKESHEINFDIFYNKILLFNNDGNVIEKEDELWAKNNRNKLFPNIRKLNSISVKKINNLNDSFNTVFPMLKSTNCKTKKNLVLNDKDNLRINEGDNKIFRYIDKKKLLKIKNNILTKSYKKNLRTENNNKNNYELNDEKKDINFKTKSNNKNN
jgi:hypothetical protein